MDAKRQGEDRAPKDALERFRRRPIRYDDPLLPVGEEDWETSSRTAIG